METNKNISWEEYNSMIKEELERERERQFKSRMVGKTFRELSLMEQSWLFTNQRLVYENLVNDKLGYTVPSHI